MYITLDNKLVQEFFKFKFSANYNKKTIFYLFKFIKPFVIGKYQTEFLDKNIQDRIIKSSRSEKELFTPVNKEIEQELINSSKLKIMLTTDKSYYPYINIESDEISNNFTATYFKGENRDKAQQHIRELLKDCAKIEIYDRYILYKNNFDTTKNILIQIFDENQNLELYCDKKSEDKKVDLRKIFSNINFHNLDKTIHDRYIKTDKFEILLSSGLYYLDNISKDFTYIVKML